jgi:hypothetical protein
VDPRPVEDPLELRYKHQMTAMITCPRCKLPQEQASECRYCGLSFEQSERGKPRRSEVISRKPVLAVFGAVLIVAVALGAYWLGSALHQTAPVAPGSNPVVAQKPRSADNALKQTARELTDSNLLIKDVARGSTKGQMIATVVFSIIGLGYMTFGKKSHRLLMVVCGVMLMSYSYFLKDTVYMVLVGIGLSLLPFVPF